MFNPLGTDSFLSPELRNMDTETPRTERNRYFIKKPLEDMVLAMISRGYSLVPFSSLNTRIIVSDLSSPGKTRIFTTELATPTYHEPIPSGYRFIYIQETREAMSPFFSCHTPVSESTYVHNPLTLNEAYVVYLNPKERDIFAY